MANSDLTDGISVYSLCIIMADKNISKQKIYRQSDFLLVNL